MTVVNGSWANNPTTFTHQWQRCDSNGLNCQPISGATQTTYTLVSADVGSTIVVQVTAQNSAGTTGPIASTPTTVIASILDVVGLFVAFPSHGVLLAAGLRAAFWGWYAPDQAFGRVTPRWPWYFDPTLALP